MRSSGRNWPGWSGKPFHKKALIPLIIIFGLAVFYVWEQVTYSELAMEIDLLQRQRDRLYQLNQYLKAERDHMTGFEVIEKKARAQLGMHFPAEGPVILVIPDQYEAASISSTMKNIWYTISSFIR